MLNKDEIVDLINKSYINRRTLLEVIKQSGSGHLGGASSAMDIMTVLYSKILKHNPKDPGWSKRDVFILSAGHKAIGYYIILQSEGYFEQQILFTGNQFHTRVPMHPDDKLLPSIEFPTGSLGHGLSVASGIALAFKRDGLNRRVFVLMGDGESAEGSVWEAALGIAKYNLDNIITIIDVNGLQSENYTKEILPVEPFENKYRDFGWSVRTINGHSIPQIYKALSEAPYEEGKPTCIIAYTKKAKGVDFMEDNPDCHYWILKSAEQISNAIESLKTCQKEEVNKIG